MRFGLEEEVINSITRVIKNHPEINEAILYGSRAKGNSKPASDIDLTFKGDNLDLSIINKISWELDDLLLPYTFDLSIYNQIQNDELLDHIERVGKIFYKK